MWKTEPHCQRINTLWTGDACLRLYITTVQDGWRKPAFLTRAWFPRTVHLITQYMEHFSEWSCWQTFIETRVFGEYFLKISVHKNWICYKFLKKHSIKVDLNYLDPGNVHLNNLNAPVLRVLKCFHYNPTLQGVCYLIFMHILCILYMAFITTNIYLFILTITIL